MKWILLVLLLTLAATPSGAATKTRTWNYASPGGGGDFTSVSVSPAGDNVIVGGDVAGAWRRNGNSGNWTRLGKFDGFTEQTCINAVAICPWRPTRVVAGTRSGIWYSPDSGQNWSQVSSDPANDQVVTAVAWARDPDSSTFVLACGYNVSGQAKITTFTGWSTGPNTATTVNCAPADDSNNKYGPLKIVFDPNTTGSSRDCYVLFGMANNLPTGGTASNIRKVIFRNMGGNGTGTFEEVSVSSGYAIDIVMDPVAGRGRYYVTASDNSAADVNGSGPVFEYTTDLNGQGLPYSSVQQLFGSSSARTGALWYAKDATADSSKIYMLTVSRDACGSTAGAGIWRKTTKAAYNSWALIDDGRKGWGAMVADPGYSGKYNYVGTENWENGWDDCSHARGETKDNPSHSISEKGTYWVTSRHIYYYGSWVESNPVLVGPPPTTTWRDSTATVTGYRDAVSTSAGSQFATLGIDNINPATMFVDGDGNVWVGYFDCGLWYGGGVYWTQKNNAATNWGWDASGKGGNVNSIWKDNDALVVSEAPSSKTNNWRLWKSTNSGSSWTEMTNLPTTFNSNNTYMRGITRDDVTGRYWSTQDGRVFFSDNLTTWTAAETTSSHTVSPLPTSWNFGDLHLGGIYAIAAHNNVVVCGGSLGLFATSNGSGTPPTTYISWGLSRIGFSDSCQYHDIATGKKDLYKEEWGGIHDIWYDKNSGYWFASCWVPNSSSCTGHLTKDRRGLWVSTDGAATWHIYPSNGAYTSDYYIRSCYSDSCNGGRMHFTSAVEYPPGGPNGRTAINATQGSMTCRWSVDGDSMYCVNDIKDISDGTGGDRTDPSWRYQFGGTVRGSQSDDSGAPGGLGSVVYVASQGNGPMYYNAVSGMDGGTCPVQITGGGGGDMRLKHPREEAQAAPLELRRIFSVREAAVLIRDGRLELFDVSGRRAHDPRPGVYFSVKRDKAGAITQRRTVLVTR